MAKDKIVTIYRYSFVEGKIYKKAFELKEAGTEYIFPHRYEYETDLFFEGYPAGCYSKRLPKRMVNELSADFLTNRELVYYTTEDNDYKYICLVNENIEEQLKTIAQMQQKCLDKQSKFNSVYKSTPLEESTEYKKLLEYMKHDL